MSSPKTETFSLLIVLSVFLQIMSSKNAGDWIYVLYKLSILGVYAEDPTLPEEDEIYDVDKGGYSYAASIAIAIIV